MLRISGERSINRVLVLKVLIGLEEGLESDKFNKDTITIISLQQQCSPWRDAQVLECSTGSSAGSKDYLKGQCGRNAWCQGGWELGTAREVARTRPTAGTRPKSTATKGFEFYSQSFENPRIITRL